MEEYKYIFKSACSLVALYALASASSSVYFSLSLNTLVLFLASFYFIYEAYKAYNSGLKIRAFLFFVIAIMPILFNISFYFLASNIETLKLSASSDVVEALDLKLKSAIAVYNLSRYLFLLIAFILILKDLFKQVSSFGR